MTIMTMMTMTIVTMATTMKAVTQKRINEVYFLLSFQQTTYIVRVDKGRVFILHNSPLSLLPFL